MTPGLLFLWYSASLGAETVCLRLGLEPMWQDSNPVLTQGLLRSQTRFQDLNEAQDSLCLITEGI